MRLFNSKAGVTRLTLWVDNYHYVDSYASEELGRGTTINWWNQLLGQIEMRHIWRYSSRAE